MHPPLETLIDTLAAFDAALVAFTAGTATPELVTTAGADFVVQLHRWSVSHTPDQPVYLDLDDFVGTVLAGG
jgi:hypothetical protein